MAIIGIDLGTTNSLGAVYRNNHVELIPNRHGSFLTPSAVSLDGEKVIVGQIAKERLVSHPELSAASFKKEIRKAEECKRALTTEETANMTAVINGISYTSVYTNQRLLDESGSLLTRIKKVFFSKIFISHLAEHINQVELKPEICSYLIKFYQLKDKKPENLIPEAQRLYHIIDRRYSIKKESREK